MRKILFFYKNIINPVAYIGFIFFITFFITYICANFIVFEIGNLLFPIVWLIGFSVLIFNVAYNLVCSLYYLITKPYILKEATLEAIPSCAIVYPIRNEAVGLYERMEYTLVNNNLPNVKFCFLSDSDPEYFEYESDVVAKLRNKFSKEKVYYWHRAKPEERKQGNIKGWLFNHYKEFKYFLVCDADSMIPKGALLKLLRKAEHPQNQDIAIFQSYTIIIHAKTLFSRWQAIGSMVMQRLYTETNQRIFGCSLSFGHGNLIRVKPFLEIEIPKGVLSHDIWDMAFLNQKGFRTVYCPDVISYEEAPSNYLEMRLRDKRWIKGNLQTFPLLAAKDLSAGARFYIFYGLYLYLSQPVFLAWIILSILGNSLLFGQFLFFKPLIFTEYNATINIKMVVMTIMILTVVFFHKFVICRSKKDIIDIVKELFISSLICLNNIFYQSLDIIIIIFRKIKWIPMKKDPYDSLSIMKTVKNFWLSTSLGVFLLFFGLINSPHGTLFALPILLNFALSIPVIYITSLPWPLKILIKG